MARITTLGEKVRHLRVALGMSQQQLADAVSQSQQSIDAIEAGRTQRPRSIVDIAKVLNVSVEMLTDDAVALDTDRREFTRPFDGHGPLFTAAMAGAPAPAPDLADIKRMPQDVPVLGTAEGGEVGDFMLNGETIDYLRRPPGIARAKDVFALYVTGLTMFPRFNEGDPVYATTGRPPAIGDDVIIELHPTQAGEVAGAGFIKRLKRRTPTKIVVEQFNPPAEREFDREKVKNLYRIIPWAELLGI